MGGGGYAIGAGPVDGGADGDWAVLSAGRRNPIRAATNITR